MLHECVSVLHHKTHNTLIHSVLYNKMCFKKFGCVLSKTLILCSKYKPIHKYYEKNFFINFMLFGAKCLCRF